MYRLLKFKEYLIILLHKYDLLYHSNPFNQANQYLLGNVSGSTVCSDCEQSHARRTHPIISIIPNISKPE